jgi:hypothetical protein
VRLSGRDWSHGAIVWLILATVLAFALDPFGSAARPTRGSAFSYFTTDVSLAPNRAPTPDRPRPRSVPPVATWAAIVPATMRAVTAVAVAPFAPTAAAETAAKIGFVVRRMRTRGPPPGAAG